MVRCSFWAECWMFGVWVFWVLRFLGCVFGDWCHVLGVVCVLLGVWGCVWCVGCRVLGNGFGCCVFGVGCFGCCVFCAGCLVICGRCWVFGVVCGSSVGCLCLVFRAGCLSDLVCLGQCVSSVVS